MYHFSSSGARLTLLVFLVAFFFTFSANCILLSPSTVPDFPWIKRTNTCGYDQCVEIDFTQVPSHWEILGSQSDFAHLFLLQPMDGPEPGTDPPNCVHDTPGVNGTYACLFSSNLVQVKNSLLELSVTGPTPVNGTVLVSQVTFFDPYFSEKNITLVKNGFFEIEAQTSDIPGSCVGIFTQAFPPPPDHWDEQDIEILTAHYTVPDKNVTSGINLVNWNAFPKNDTDRLLYVALPYVFYPPESFQFYSIFWDNVYTVYAWGNQSKIMDKYSSQNPSVLSINNWSDGGWYWSQGPPKEKSVLKIRKINVYYNL